jgi:hypothetical protein
MGCRVLCGGQGTSTSCSLVLRLSRTNIQGCVKALATVHLEPGICLSKQSKAKQKLVCEQVRTFAIALFDLTPLNLSGRCSISDPGLLP